MLATLITAPKKYLCRTCRNLESLKHPEESGGPKSARGAFALTWYQKLPKGTDRGVSASEGK
jgi:hypothetical protein